VILQEKENAEHINMKTKKKLEDFKVPDVSQVNCVFALGACSHQEQQALVQAHQPHAKFGA
jgi:hypothetical protein